MRIPGFSRDDGGFASLSDEARPSISLSKPLVRGVEGLPVLRRSEFAVFNGGVESCFVDSWVTVEVEDERLKVEKGPRWVSLSSTFIISRFQMTKST